jgi:hypothetical protein
MRDVKKLQLVGLRRGKRVVLWLHVLLGFVVMVSVMTLVSRGIAWIWNAAEPTHQIESWTATISRVLTAGGSIMAVFVLFAWRRPDACSTKCDDSAPPLAP